MPEIEVFSISNTCIKATIWYCLVTLIRKTFKFIQITLKICMRRENIN